MKRAVLLGALAAAVVGGLAFRSYLRHDYRPLFARAAGTLVAVRDSTGVGRAADGKAVTDVTLVSDTGLEVLVRVRARGDLAGRRYPATILVGGFETGRRAAEVPPATGDLVVASLEYPYDGPRRGVSWWELPRWLPAMRRAVLDTPSAILLVAQYLYAREDVDPERVTVVGVSLGVPFAVAAGATDRRIAGVAALHGGGDLRPLFAHAYRDLGPPWVVAAMATAVAWLAAPLEPTKYADDVAPRPFLQVNGTEDEFVPESSAMALYRAARRPKRLVWIPSAHVRANATEIVARLLEIALEWMDARGLADLDARRPAEAP